MSIIPKAMDNSRSPMDVSKEIAVVSTLVYPRMFPPIIIATPTSDKARPNPKRMAAMTATFASFIIVNMTCRSVAPREAAVSLICTLTPPRAEMVRPIMMGVMSIVWPMIIPPGLKRRPKLPSGPDLDRSRNTNKPTVTVGRL